VNYHYLSPGYWSLQIERVLGSVRRILDRAEAPKTGRVVPGNDALVIGDGRALRMAVLFLDISGFSGRPAEDAPEQHVILQTLNLFFTEMVRVAEDYGGTVEKNTGDGLMAYFEDGGGDPAEEGCTRAVAAALTMMHVNDHAITPVLRSSNVEPIRFRVGIDYGVVTVARVGVARGFNANVAVGTAANIASKLLAKADPDDVVIGEAVYNRLPAGWRQWATAKDSSGFVYRRTGQPYLAYDFSGRWVTPTTQ
jgi:class 3 adenylate cyclase